MIEKIPNLFRKCTILLSVVLLASCATATPYQPNIAGQRVSGGYSETRLGHSRFRVSFAGNSFTSRDQVENYLLYRAAELTLANDFDWFSVDMRETEHDRRTYTQPTYRYSYWRPYWRYYRPGMGWNDWHYHRPGYYWSHDYDIRTVDRFEARAEITMHNGPVPQDEENAFDARAVQKDLRVTIVRPNED